MPADHAVAVLVAAPLPAGIGVGEVRGHAQFVAQPRVAVCVQLVVAGLVTMIFRV